MIMLWQLLECAIAGVFCVADIVVSAPSWPPCPIPSSGAAVAAMSPEWLPWLSIGSVEQGELDIVIIKYVIMTITGTPKMSEKRNELRHLETRARPIQYYRHEIITRFDF